LRSSWTRIALLALLLLALPPGASLATGLQSEATLCCCTDHGSTQSDTRVDSPSCCTVSDNASLPVTAPATCPPLPSTPLMTVCDATGVSVGAIDPSRAMTVIESDRSQRPPRSLFTLHAAFLI